jgi:hypothetical protein
VEGIVVVDRSQAALIVATCKIPVLPTPAAESTASFTSRRESAAGKERAL